MTHNWVRRSIFWELLYWKTNLLHHNMDAIHIKKNVFENIFNTMMDVKGKTKDNMKTIMNIPLFFYYKNIELVYNWLMVVKPKASFVLDKNVQLLVYQSLKSQLFFMMNMLRIYLDWWIWRMKNCMKWKVKIAMYLCKHSFHLLTRIYC